MARWKLNLAHYLMTDPPSQVEFKETDRNTGRQARKVYDIPTYLDPKDPASCNYPDEVVVCNGNNPQGRDIIFKGDPTADMEPIDDEAKKISKSFIDSGRWAKREDGIEYGESLIKTFMEKISQLQIGSAPPVAVPAIDPEAFATLQAQVKLLTEQNAKLQAQTRRSV